MLATNILTTRVVFIFVLFQHQSCTTNRKNNPPSEEQEIDRVHTQSHFLNDERISELVQ